MLTIREQMHALNNYVLRSFEIRMLQDIAQNTPGATGVGWWALQYPAGSDVTQQAWWNANCGGAIRTLHGDGSRNRR